MTKTATKLDGRELAGFIKERHRQQIAGLGVVPKLAIIQANDDAATEAYIRVKSRYGRDVGAEVEVHKVEQAEILPLVAKLNTDTSVHGIIVQLPIPDQSQTDQVTSAIDPYKDVDGLHPDSQFTAATPMAILWLLAGYNIDPKGRVVTVVGQGQLVGKPLSDLLENSEAQVVRCDKNTEDLKAETLKADIVISGTGVPGLIKPGMVKRKAVIVDAGAGEAGGSVVGDVDPDLFKDDSLKITPNPGGVGPMTVVALFENLIQAASA